MTVELSTAPAPAAPPATSPVAPPATSPVAPPVTSPAAPAPAGHAVSPAAPVPVSPSTPASAGAGVPDGVAATLPPVFPAGDPNAAPVRTPGGPARAGNNMSRSRAGILRGAARCLVRYGSRKTTMGDIAREGGVAKATLYNHFRTKADVYAALLDAELAALLDEVVAAGSPVAALTVAARRVAEHPVLRALVAREPETAAAFVVPVRGPAWSRVQAAAARIAAEAGDGGPGPDVLLRWVLSHVYWPGSAADVETGACALLPS